MRSCEVLEQEIRHDGEGISNNSLAPYFSAESGDRCSRNKASRALVAAITTLDALRGRSECAEHSCICAFVMGRVWRVMLQASSIP